MGRAEQRLEFETTRPSQVGVDGAMRARDVSAPTEDDLARARRLADAGEREDFTRPGGSRRSVRRGTAPSARTR